MFHVHYISGLQDFTLAFLTSGILCMQLIIEICIHSADACILTMSCVGYARVWLKTLSSLLKITSWLIFSKLTNHDQSACDLSCPFLVSLWTSKHRETIASKANTCKEVLLTIWLLLLLLNKCHGWDHWLSEALWQGLDSIKNIGCDAIDPERKNAK